ncbi:MAG: tetratricopeptide repeat protein [Phycisphaerales bacterium]|jgi:tetratricopeptide (TPR) repeat protein|nr:hypothetical protein [Phycisphaeraceae bacterium]
MKTRTLVRTGLMSMAIVGAFAVGLHAAPSREKPPAKPATPADAPAKPRLGGKAADLYERGVTLAKAGKFADALSVFEEADKVQPDDADITNMRAFTMRKTGKVRESLDVYAKALKLRDKFPEAREYLGEAYLHLAHEQLKTLRDYGQEGEQDFFRLQQRFKDYAGAAEGKDLPQRAW